MNATTVERWESDLRSATVMITVGTMFSRVWSRLLLEGRAVYCRVIFIRFRENEPFAKPVGEKRLTVERAFDEASRRQPIKCAALRSFLDLAFGDKRDYVHVPINAKGLLAVTFGERRGRAP